MCRVYIFRALNENSKNWIQSDDRISYFDACDKAEGAHHLNQNEKIFYPQFFFWRSRTRWKARLTWGTSILIFLYFLILVCIMRHTRLRARIDVDHNFVLFFQSFCEMEGMNQKTFLKYFFVTRQRNPFKSQGRFLKSVLAVQPT